VGVAEVAYLICVNNSRRSIVRIFFKSTLGPFYFFVVRGLIFEATRWCAESLSAGRFCGGADAYHLGKA